MLFRMLQIVRRFRMKDTILEPIRVLVSTIIAVILSVLQGCTHFAIKDCGEEVIGKNEPRIRSSHFRMLLADLPATANRFAPYAAMSALAYAQDENCGTEEKKLTPEERTKLKLALEARGWEEVKDVQWVPSCEDDTGLFLNVWKRAGATTDVVVAFRGTWGLKDWLYGNLHWFTRFLPMDDQFVRARQVMQRVFEQFSGSPDKAYRFYTTGHSLGGGLAQHILYSYPDKVIQAIAFDPSSVTGFADQTPANQVAGCECSAAELDGEPRIFRVYDAYEILANLRIFHKTFFPPERHIQEVRIPTKASHSMKGLAFYLLDQAASKTDYSHPWYTGKGHYIANETCTEAFKKHQQKSCEIKVAPGDWRKCPQ